MIRNSVQLSTTTTRKHILRILEAGLQAVSPEQLIREQFAYDAKKDTLYVQGKAYQLRGFERVVVIGVGKVAAHVAELIESKMLNRIAGGIVIDVVPANTKKIVSLVGTHPLPSTVNVSATDELVTMLQNLTAKDLVLAIISGGGSSLLTSPQVISLEEERKITQALMDCGASITEMNTVRKHLSSVKGGNLAKYAYPASMISLIFSDIPGDDISQVASGPTVLDETTINDATEIMNRYQVLDRCSMDHCGMRETPKEQRYFNKVTNILFCSSAVALQAMERCAHDLGLRVKIWQSAFSGEASELAKEILADLEPNQCLLAAGESVVTIKGNLKGSGGRNQEMALAALLSLPDKVTFAALNSDGHDNSDVAGALVDNATLAQAKKLGLDLPVHLAHHDEYGLLSDLGASIMTGHTGSNVSDLVVAIKD
jgi:glycerate 2-kinase